MSVLLIRFHCLYQKIGEGFPTDAHIHTDIGRLAAMADGGASAIFTAGFHLYTELLRLEEIRTDKASNRTGVVHGSTLVA
jgi:hypothetical protein